MINVYVSAENVDNDVKMRMLAFLRQNHCNIESDVSKRDTVSIVIVSSHREYDRYKNSNSIIYDLRKNDDAILPFKETNNIVDAYHNTEGVAMEKLLSCISSKAANAGNYVEKKRVPCEPNPYNQSINKNVTSEDKTKPRTNDGDVKFRFGEYDDQTSTHPENSPFKSVGLIMLIVIILLSLGIVVSVSDANAADIAEAMGMQDIIEDSFVTSSIRLNDSIVGFTSEILSADEMEGTVILEAYDTYGAASMIKMYEAQKSNDVSFEESILTAEPECFGSLAQIQFF